MIKIRLGAYMTEPSANELEITGEIIAEFINESDELLAKAESALISMENRPGDTEVLNSALRAFHTIKGTADYLGFKALKELTHFCEELLDKARGRGESPEKHVLIWLIKAVDETKLIIRNGLGGRKRYDRDAFEAASAEFLEKISAGIISGMNQSRAVQDSGLSVDMPENSAADLRPVLKIDAYKLNSMMNSLNELAVAETNLRRTLKGVIFTDPESYDDYKKKLSALGRITAKLNYDSYAMKMLPFQHLFNKMTRLIRDLSVKSGKKLKLLLNGGDTEIDREIIENLAEPLIHILRNSVDHGIEDADVRKKSGKAEAGTVSLSAFCRDGNIIVTVSDDGHGLDREKILEKARRLGIAGADGEISDEKVNELIMMPGFSTADKVSELSGRGVGMDVVKKTVESLRGSMKIRSIKGQGTKITMVFPVNMAVIEGLTVCCRGDAYVIPSSNVISVVTAAGPHHGGPEEDGEIINTGLFGTAPAPPGDGQDPDKTADKHVIVKLERNGIRKKLLAERILSLHKVAVKNIPGLALEKTPFSGAAIMPDGRPAMILSPDRLILKGEK